MFRKIFRQRILYKTNIVIDDKKNNKLILLILFFLIVSACSSNDSSGPELGETSSDAEGLDSEKGQEENDDEEDS